MSRGAGLFQPRYERILADKVPLVTLGAGTAFLRGLRFLVVKSPKEEKGVNGLAPIAPNSIFRIFSPKIAPKNLW